MAAAHSKSRSDNHTDFSAVFRCFIGVYAEARVVGFRRLQRNKPVLLRDINADVLCQLVIAVLGTDTGGTVKCRRLYRVDQCQLERIQRGIDDAFIG